jgi:hypothetical protein
MDGLLSHPVPSGHTVSPEETPEGTPKDPDGQPERPQNAPTKPLERCWFNPSAPPHLRTLAAAEVVRALNSPGAQLAQRIDSAQGLAALIDYEWEDDAAGRLFLEATLDGLVAAFPVLPEEAQ